MENVKIELINENKLKAVLSCLDILSLDCDVSELFGESVSHKLIDRILKEAYDEFSFTADISKSLIETIPSATDGYIVFISKIKDENEQTKSKAIFAFSDYFSLKKAIDGIKNIFYGASALFELDGRYYLILNSVFWGNFKKTQIILTEFGEKIDKPEIFEAVLSEYGRKLFEKDAIKTIRNNK